MKKEEIIAKVKTLNLPKGSYVVFGSCPLSAVDIREANDIDLLVSREVFTKLRQIGWQELHKSSNDIPLTHDVFEAHDNWDFSSYSPTLDQLLVNAMVIDGVAFASLEEVRKWKIASGRPKDIADIKLIDEYLLKKLRRATLIASTGASTRLAGSKLSDENIEQISKSSGQK